MLTYNSSLQDRRPYSDTQRAAAMADMRQPSPYAQFGQNHQDVLAALNDNAATVLDMEAYKTNANYALRQQDAQRQLALAGLRQQAEAEQNQRDLGTNRLQMMTGFANNLLGGLFS
jgi:hypothetical protein